MSFQFWLDNDDDDDDDNSITKSASQTFRCPTCGDTDNFEYDESTGTNVCRACFTSSQTTQTQQELEYEDIMELAAKTKRGALVTRKRKRVNNQNQKRWPLEDLDKSQPLPDLETCLEGFVCVLRHSTKCLGQLLPQTSTASKRSLMRTVQHLWVAYLRAFADGAQHYGNVCPELRISLRDAFVGHVPKFRDMIYSQVVASAAAKHGTHQQEQTPRANAHDDEPPPANAQEVLETTMRKKPATNQKSSVSKPRFKPEMSVRRIVQVTQGIRADGYREAALKIKPTMEFVALLLWLAVCDTVTSAELTQWILDGKIPLLNAYDTMLSETLRRKLRAIRSFFQPATIPSPGYLEHNGTLLAIACRIKKESTDGIDRRVVTPDGAEEMYFWNQHCLPMIVSRLVTAAGFDRGVLNRTLALMNLHSMEGYKALERVTTNSVSRNEDILAVIAIACLMDPEWCRKWECQTHQIKHEVVPYNESQFRTLKYRNLGKFLDFAETTMLDSSKGKLWDGFGELLNLHSQTTEGDWNHSVVDNNSVDEDGDIGNAKSVAVQPCPILAGHRLPLDPSREEQSRRRESWIGTTNVAENVQRTLLIEHLAYTANAKVARIRSKLKYFLKEDGKEEIPRLDDPTATFIGAPPNLHAIWYEFEFGIGGSKPGKYFTSRDRRHIEKKYARRKAVWKCVSSLIEAGLTSVEACDLIERVYGSDKPLHTIAAKLRQDEANGGHPELQPEAVRREQARRKAVVNDEGSKKKK